MSERCIYWQHRANDRLSDFYFGDPTRLLSHHDEYYEDFYIGKHSPSPMVLRTVGYRRCDPHYHFKGISMGGRYFIMYVFEGEGYVDGELVARGDTVFFDRRRISNFSTNPDKPCVYGWVTFVDGNSDELVKKMRLSNRNCIYRTDHIEQIESIFKDMLYMKHDGNVELYMESCLLRLLALSERPETKTEATHEAVNNRHLNLALQYISFNLNRANFRISDISDSVGISENYLRTLFREEMGISIRDYVTQQRINIAVNLLKSSNYNINEIATFCGYSDYRQFSEQFKKRIGVSPSKFKSK